MFLDVYIFDRETGLQTFDTIESLNRAEANSIVWVDIENPEQEPLRAVASHFGFHELTVEDCFDPDHSPKLEDYGGYLFMIFRGLNPLPAIDQEEKDLEEDAEEEDYAPAISMYLSERYIVTHRLREIPWLDAVLRQVKAIPERTIAEGSSALAYRIIDVLVDRFARGLQDFERIIDNLEDTAIETPEKFEIGDILTAKRNLGTLRQLMREQLVVINRLAHDRTLIKPQRLRRYFKDVEDHAAAVIRDIDQLSETIIGVRDVYFTMTNVRLQDIMRILTVFTTVGVPLNIIVGLYGMNFEWIPFLHSPYGFWIVAVVMLALVVVMFFFFKKRMWI
ncbi:MAG: magnesium transporter CorA family protein [Deltaproteobacteria bacterium]|nr:magnesium transporter CorA family protein [Deltaproteobacteria bacterium]